MRWLWTILAILASVASAEAFTCDDVRALSPEQQAYYIRVFNITPAQQDHIRRLCYGSRAHRPSAVSEEKPTGSIARSERDQVATSLSSTHPGP
jgi:hypothetical protein